jgi:hypothetical protein
MREWIKDNLGIDVDIVFIKIIRFLLENFRC